VVRGDWERYQHYLEFLEEAIAREQSLQKTSTKESSLKLKIKEAGQETYEPKLANKKYRRPSRRGKNQDQERYENKTLQDIYNDDSE
jgi:ribosome biogenesis GTPase